MAKEELSQTKEAPPDTGSIEVLPALDLSAASLGKESRVVVHTAREELSASKNKEIERTIEKKVSGKWILQNPKSEKVPTRIDQVNFKGLTDEQVGIVKDAVRRSYHRAYQAAHKEEAKQKAKERKQNRSALVDESADEDKKPEKKNLVVKGPRTDFNMSDIQGPSADKVIEIVRMIFRDKGTYTPIDRGAGHRVDSQGIMIPQMGRISPPRETEEKPLPRPKNKKSGGA